MTTESDTSADAEEVQARIFRQMSGSERVEAAARMSAEAREVTRAGIRHRHPTWTEAEVHAEFLRLTLGDELAAKVLESRRP